MVDEAQRCQWDDDGFFIIRGFADPQIGAAMHKRVVEISRAARSGVHDGFFLSRERNLAASVGADAAAEQRMSKIFRLHRDETFRAFIESPPILEIGRSLLGPQLDCFLSQFIFKNPGAWGQPWHQDSYYFPFDKTPQVGLWLAVTAATLENGCLWVLPGSHKEPVHRHIPDQRPNANDGYVEITDTDFSAEQPVTMAAGDLLVFHSHLMHRSRDNQSNGLRAAMVYHLAEHGTLDRSREPAPINDWMRLPEPQPQSSPTTGTNAERT